MKKILCVFMAVMLAASCLAFSASALNPENKSVTLHVTKYQIAQKNGETDKIGTTATLTGTSADAPEGATPLANVEFTIFKIAQLDTYISQEQIQAIDSSYNSSDKSVTYNGNTITGTSQTTGTNGVADFTVTGAEQGVYFVKETSAPEFVTEKASSFVVSLPMTNTDSRDGFMYEVYAYPKNYTTLGGAVFKMVDSSNNVALTGAKFAIYKSNGTQVTQDAYGNSIGDENHYLTTDSDGIIYVNNLAPGSYYFRETVAPEGHMLNNTNYTFTVESGKSTEVKTDNNQLVYEGIDLITGSSFQKPGVSLYVTEVGKTEDSVSFDELIRWYVISDVPSDMGTAYKKYNITVTLDETLDLVSNSLTVTFVTDRGEETADSSWYTVSDVQNQEFTVTFTDFTSLSTAKSVKLLYKVKLNETKTVMGDNIYCNALLNYKTDVIDESAYVTNQPSVYTGGFKFKNVSAKDNATALTGAKFEVYTGDHNILIATNVTPDENGLFEVKGLTSGDYYLVQTTAPQGYELKSGKINFTVTKTSYDNEQPLNVINTPTYELPLTGGFGTEVFVVIGFALITLSAIVFVVSKKAKN